MECEEKSWGQRFLVFDSGNLVVEKIVVREGESCSIHRHHRKNNLFYVGLGTLRVKTFGKVMAANQRVIGSCQLKAADSKTIPAGVWHQFTADSDVVAFEVYLSAVPGVIDKDDIDRWQSTS